MTNRKTLSALALIALVVITLLSINSCKTESNPQPLEPISLVSPDTPISRYFGGDSFPVIIKFTTDRPINWIMGLTDVDTLIDSTNYTPTYEDTLFRKDLTTLSPRQNLYTYTGHYHVADSLLPFSVIRFKVSFNAGSSTFETGQNYPQGIVSYSKEFKVNVR
jgi:hypothetical protein